MKRVLTLNTLLLFFSSILSPVVAQENAFINDFLERLENSRRYLILVAETMPEDKYSFKATPDMLTFAESFMHIAWAMDWHSQSLLGGREARDWETDEELKVGSKSKAEMIATIDRTFEETIKLIRKLDVTELDASLDYFGLTRTKRQILLLLVDHITHHRGQMLVSMRLNGYTPPRYVLFQ